MSDLWTLVEEPHTDPEGQPVGETPPQEALAHLHAHT